jgi:inosine-uridine nucleoside N-ribohydrolase
VTAIIGSHLAPGDAFDPSVTSAEDAVEVVQNTLALMNLNNRYPVYAGSNTGLISASDPLHSEAAMAIVAEAMRTDTDLPLFIAMGGGLTELASAYLIEPKIADRLTAVWIGGQEHEEGGANLPIMEFPEYNLGIDPLAAQTVFNRSTIPLWQIPRNVYSQCLISRIELENRVRPTGSLGAFLVESLDAFIAKVGRFGFPESETYAMGDNPLVLVTALQSLFGAESTSCRHMTIPTPHLNLDGSYTPAPDGRPLRVYSQVDCRLMFEDFFHKLAAFVRQSESTLAL